MLRTALGLTSILLLTACAGNAPAQYNASKDGGFTNARMQTAASFDTASLPSPKFKPMWMALAEASMPVKSRSVGHVVSYDTAEDAPSEGYIFEKPASFEQASQEKLQEQIQEPFHQHASKEKSVSMASAKVSDSELGENRGTFSPEVLNSTVLEATTTQNISTNSVTGDNIVNSSAFSNAQGLVNLIQNSGNNVVIQSSTVVNLTFQ